MSVQLSKKAQSAIRAVAAGRQYTMRELSEDDLRNIVNVLRDFEVEQMDRDFARMEIAEINNGRF
jgi:hypothetical protein